MSRKGYVNPLNTNGSLTVAKRKYPSNPQYYRIFNCQRPVAVQDLTRKYPWFAASVEDIRMLRIEDNNDLMPAIEMIAG